MLAMFVQKAAEEDGRGPGRWKQQAQPLQERPPLQSLYHSLTKEHEEVY